MKLLTCFRLTPDSDFGRLTQEIPKGKEIKSTGRLLIRYLQGG